MEEQSRAAEQLCNPHPLEILAWDPDSTPFRTPWEGP